MKNVFVLAFMLAASVMAAAQTSLRPAINEELVKIFYIIEENINKEIQQPRNIHIRQYLTPEGTDNYKLVVPSNMTGEKAVVLNIGSSIDECMNSLGKLENLMAKNGLYTLQGYELRVHSRFNIMSFCHSGKLSNMRGCYLLDMSNLLCARHALAGDHNGCPICHENKKGKK